MRQGVDVNVLSYALREGDKYPGEADFYRTVPRTGNTLLYSKSFYEYMQSHPVYDIYHSNGLWQYPSHATAVYAHKMHKPYIMTPHGMLYPEALKRSYWKKWPLLQLYFRKDINEATCIHVTCRKEMEHVREFGYKGPIAVIPNPANLPDYIDEITMRKPSFLTDGQQRKFGFLGRLHPIKKVENLIYAVAKLQPEDYELVIMGKGDDAYEQFLRDEVRQLGLKNVVFKGFVTGREKFEELA